MNYIQKECLYIMDEFHRLCEIHDIKYCLIAGTLLGAVRHDGFIPWDDDLDVAMTREEYNRFLEVASTGLSSDFFLQTMDTEKYYFNSFAKIRSNRVKLAERPTSKHKINQGVWIDVFPMDSIPDSLVEKDNQFARFNNIDNKIRKQAYLYVSDSDRGLKKYIKLIIQNINAVIIRINPHLKKLVYKRSSIIQEYNNKGFENVNLLSYPLSKKEYPTSIMKKSDLTRLKLHNFEGREFWIPVNYDDILTVLYGDYMVLPLEEERVGSHGINIEKKKY